MIRPIFLLLIFSLTIILSCNHVFADSLACQNCTITITQNSNPLAPTTTTPTGTIDNSPIPSSLDGIVAKLNSFIQRLVGNANIDPNSNPVGISSDKLKTITNSGYGVAKQTIGLEKTVNNFTATAINEISPIKLSTTVLWVLGFIISGYFIFIIVKKFWKHFFALAMLIILVIVFLVALGVHQTTTY